MAFKTSSRYDLKPVHEAVMDWADYQNLTGELDTVETSSIVGQYDWKAYLKEESEIAQAREDRRRAKAEKKGPVRAPPGPAPSQFYG